VDRCLLSDVTHSPGVRAERKLRTRQALLAAALDRMEHQSFGSLSLREVTRTVGIVPAGFYRHFPDMDSLGVALVEESLGGLRAAVRAVRDGLTDSDEIIHRSLGVLVRTVNAHRPQFRFIVRERFGGVSRVRQAIAGQLRLFGDELAGDLLAGRIATVSDPHRWTPADLHMLTGLVVDHMVLTVAALLDVPPGARAAQRAVVDVAAKRLRLIVLGSRHWPGD
jgi:AcrR family transcriptional regulator